MTEHLTLDGLLMRVQAIDDVLDSSGSPDYLAQPLARHWARVTKVCEEAGEVWQALSKWTGENPRKACGTKDELLGELGDTLGAAICAIQHLTKDTEATWAVVSAAVDKCHSRLTEPALSTALLSKRQETP
jgi:NTP pyrophosphatase (non-canonical NTP hydrolase)